VDQLPSLEMRHACVRRLTPWPRVRQRLKPNYPPRLWLLPLRLEHAAAARESLTAYWRHTQLLAKTRTKALTIRALAERYLRCHGCLSVMLSQGLPPRGSKRSVLTTGISSDASWASADIVPTLTRSDHGEQIDVRLDDFQWSRGSLSAPLSFRRAFAMHSRYRSFSPPLLNKAPAARFVVLDDVTSSFDAGHQLRLMDEIRLGLQYHSGGSGLQFLILVMMDSSRSTSIR